MLTLGERLRDLRSELGVTIGAAAKEIDISPSSLSDYENDEKLPGCSILLKMSDYYSEHLHRNISCDYIMRGIDSEYIRIHKATGLKGTAIGEIEHQWESSYYQKFNTLNILLENGFAGILGGVALFADDYCNAAIRAESQYAALHEMHKSAPLFSDGYIPSTEEIREHNEGFDGITEPDPHKPGIINLNLSLGSYLHLKLSMFGEQFTQIMKKAIENELEIRRGGGNGKA